MQDYITFSTSLLSAIVDFLQSTPIFYIFGVILLCFIIKAFKMIIKS